MPFRVQRKRASCDLRHTTTERAPVVFGPSDCLVLLDHAGNFQTREVYTPLRGAQTGEDSFFGLFCDAQLMLMGFV